jgi:hypothetical protein
MNAAAMIRRFEAGGFTHEQATCLAETLTDEVEATVATREFVEQAIARALTRFAAEDLAALRRDFAEELHALRREMASKEDHAALVDEMAQMRREMATKDDIRRLDARIDELAGRMATKDDIRGMATKDDMRDMATNATLERLRKEMVTKEYVDSVASQAKAEIIKWHAGIVIVQTVAVLSAAVAIGRLLAAG